MNPARAMEHASGASSDVDAAGFLVFMGIMLLATVAWAVVDKFRKKTDDHQPRGP